MGQGINKGQKTRKACKDGSTELQQPKQKLIRLESESQSML